MQRLYVQGYIQHVFVWSYGAMPDFPGGVTGRQATFWHPHEAAPGWLCSRGTPRIANRHKRVRICPGMGRMV